MASDMTGEQMQAKITAARREAEGLKDKIKRRKDELADTSRTNFLYFCSPLLPPHPDISSNDFASGFLSFVCRFGTLFRKNSLGSEAQRGGD